MTCHVASLLPRALSVAARCAPRREVILMRPPSVSGVAQAKLSSPNWGVKPRQRHPSRNQQGWLLLRPRETELSAPLFAVSLQSLLPLLPRYCLSFFPCLSQATRSLTAGSLKDLISEGPHPNPRGAASQPVLLGHWWTGPGPARMNFPDCLSKQGSTINESGRNRNRWAFPPNVSSSIIKRELV